MIISNSNLKYSVMKLRNSQIYEQSFQLLHNLNYSSFFQVFVHISEIHTIQKNIFEEPGSSYFYGVGKKSAGHILLSSSKMKVLLWHSYQVIQRYENLCCSTESIYIHFCYITIFILMFIEIWCIRTASQVCFNR